MRKLWSFAISMLLIAAALPSDAGARRPTARETTASLMKQADALVLIGSYDRAATGYRKVLVLAPRHAPATARLAHALWRVGKTGQALKLLEGMATDKHPPVVALQVLSDIHLQQKNYLGAAAVLERLVANNQQDLKLKMQLADCYRQMARLNNPEARARALTLYAAVERAAKTAGQRTEAMEAGLTMRYGELGEKIIAAKTQITEGKTVKALKQLNALAKQNSKVAYLHYLRGMAYLSPEVDDRKSAMSAFAKAAAHPEAALQLGVLLYEDGELALALAHLQAAVKADPANQKALYHIGLIHREEGLDSKAIKAWRKAITIAPTSPIAQWARTKLQVLTGRIRSLAPGQVIDPSTEILIGKKTCERIEKRWPVLQDSRLEQRLNRIMDRLLRHSDRPKRDLRYKIAVINLPILNALTVPNGKIYFFTGLIDLIRTRMGDSDDAYAAVLAHEISHNVLRHGTGMIKVASTQKKYNSVWELRQLMSALSRTHEFEADQYGALYAYRAGFDPSMAVLLHQKMLQHRGGEIPRGMSHPQHRERIAHLRDYLLELRAKVRHFKKGLAAVRSKDYDRAVDHLELFLGVFPDSGAARNNLAVALHRKALLNTRAAPVYRRSTDVDPEARIRRIRLRSSESERRRNRRVDKRLLREAVGEYAMVIRKRPHYAIARNNLATALSDLGEPRLARKHLQLALTQRPSYKEAWNNLGVVLAQARDYRGAAKALSKAVAIDSKYAAAHFNIALVQEKLGNRPAARKHWERYVALDGDSGWATIARSRRAALD